MTSKRYILLEADGEVTPQDWKDFARYLEERFGKLKPIPVKGNDRALVVKTDNRTAPLIRKDSPGMRVGGRKVTSVLTSGSIGKLKRLATDAEARDIGKIPE